MAPGRHRAATTGTYRDSLQGRQAVSVVETVRAVDHRGVIAVVGFDYVAHEGRVRRPFQPFADAGHQRGGATVSERRALVPPVPGLRTDPLTWDTGYPTQRLGGNGGELVDRVEHHFRVPEARPWLAGPGHGQW